LRSFIGLRIASVPGALMLRPAPAFAQAPAELAAGLDAVKAEFYANRERLRQRAPSAKTC